MSKAERNRPTLRRKLLLARKAAEAVEKRGTNSEGDYTYARAEDVLAEASKQLEKRGILIVPEMVEEALHFGKEGTIAKAVIVYEVSDTESGESFKVRWAGTGYDSPGDKALFKAVTGTEKYFLAKLLGIPFGTDPEAEAGAAEPDRIRREQDAAATAPDLGPPARSSLPESDLPEADWTAEEVSVA